MATTHEELRDHLLAVIEAAQELPREDREHLADVFLQELDRGYTLLPRGSRGRQPRDRRPFAAGFPFWPVAAAALGVFFLLPLLLLPLFFLIHLPFLFLIVAFLFVMRFGGWGMGWRHGYPRRW